MKLSLLYLFALVLFIAGCAPITNNASVNVINKENTGLAKVGEVTIEKVVIAGTDCFVAWSKWTAHALAIDCKDAK